MSHCEAFNFELLETPATESISALFEELGVEHLMRESASQHLTGDPSWRLTLTDSFASTAARIFDAPGYTIARGSGESGARTGRQTNGSYDIVISVQALFPDDLDSLSVEEARAFILASAKHLSTHEAMHIELSDRLEADDYFRDLITPLPRERLFWRNYVAVAIDEYRIECAAQAIAPAPRSNIESFEYAAEALLDSLNQSSAIAPFDFPKASDLVFGSVHNFLTHFAYTMAEHRSGYPLPEMKGILEEVKLELLHDLTSETLSKIPDARGLALVEELGVHGAQLSDSVQEWLEELGITPKMNADMSYQIHWR